VAFNSHTGFVICQGNLRLIGKAAAVAMTKPAYNYR